MRQEAERVRRSKFVSFPKQTVRVYNFIILRSAVNNMLGNLITPEP